MKKIALGLRRAYRAEELSFNEDLGWIRFKLPNGSSSEKVVRELLKETGVDFATPDYEITYHGHTTNPPNDWLWTNHWDGIYPPPYHLSYLWGLDKIGMEQAWKLSNTQGGGVLIAIIDGAIDNSNLDLVNNYDSGIGEKSYCTSPATGIQKEHGTSVAGVIAASGNNGRLSKDTTFFVGVNQTARYIPIRIGCPTLSLSRAIEGIHYAILRGAGVINASWGVYGLEHNHPLILALRGEIQNGINSTLLVSSAGNEVRDFDLCPEPTLFPQMFGLENVIVVAATNPHDNLWLSDPPIGDPCNPDNTADNPNRPPNTPLVSGSNYGAKSVDIAAPGELIMSVLPTSQHQHTRDPLIDYVSYADGTSVAAPFVAGCAALIQSRQIATYPGSPISPSQLKKILMTSGTAMPGPNRVSSGKRLNCHNALTQVSTNILPPPAPTNLRTY
ncbi:hypothetical protein YTPLAS72_12650 [Nitrospira sp.]|nr:hypothetical protein YTPLAS72_12650 [Nitrospira sp.]